MEERVVDDEVSGAVLGSLMNLFENALTLIRLVPQVGKDIGGSDPIHADVEWVENVGDHFDIEESSGHGVRVRGHCLVECVDDVMRMFLR